MRGSQVQILYGPQNKQARRESVWLVLFCSDRTGFEGTERAHSQQAGSRVADTTKSERRRAFELRKKAVTRGPVRSTN